MNRIRIEGERVILRPLSMDEFEASWASRLEVEPSEQPVMPTRDALRARFERSGIMQDGVLDLAIEADGRYIGEIQTYDPGDRTLPPDVFEIGISIEEPMRGKGYGTEAVRLLIGWLFSDAGATRVHMPTVRVRSGRLDPVRGTRVRVLRPHPRTVGRRRPLTARIAPSLQVGRVDPLPYSDLLDLSLRGGIRSFERSPAHRRAELAG